MDLDLHVWDGPRHTHQHSPDAAFSDSAVAGVRLLFDGDSRQPASAVAGWGVAPKELTVSCYSDLNGQGATAWLYVIRDANDPIKRRLSIAGPRQLSESPAQAHWPVLRVGAVAEVP